MKLPRPRLQKLSLGLRLLGALGGLVLLGLLIWWAARSLSRIPGQNWPEVAGIATVIASVLTLGPILWAILRYRQLAEDQKKSKHYQAWQAISDAQGKSGSGGRRTALEDLHRDGVSLQGVDLSGRAFLSGLELPGAGLGSTNLQGAILVCANLQRADLSDANLQEAILWCANLQEAILWGANLQGADLGGANLQGADLSDANFQGAILVQVDLSRARGLTRERVLSAADWRGAALPPDLSDLTLPLAALDEDLERTRKAPPPEQAT